MKTWRRTNAGVYQGSPVTVLSWELFSPTEVDTLVRFEDGTEEWVDSQLIADRQEATE